MNEAARCANAGNIACQSAVLIYFAFAVVMTAVVLFELWRDRK